MRRTMPPLALQFRAACDAACELATAGERVRVLADPAARRELTLPRLEYLYEIAFLRMFVAWELFLEESFLRYMCGYTGFNQAPQQSVLGNYSRTLTDARSALYGTQQYLLWHSPAKVIARSQKIFKNGVHETVISSTQARIGHFSCIRHRIAHGQLDAQKKFDAATMTLVGRRYPASRVGRFLRDADPGLTPPTRWLSSIADELANLALQVAP